MTEVKLALLIAWPVEPHLWSPKKAKSDRLDLLLVVDTTEDAASLRTALVPLNLGVLYEFSQGAVQPYAGVDLMEAKTDAAIQEGLKKGTIIWLRWRNAAGLESTMPVWFTCEGRRAEARLTRDVHGEVLLDRRLQQTEARGRGLLPVDAVDGGRSRRGAVEDLRGRDERRGADAEAGPPGDPRAATGADEHARGGDRSRWTATRIARSSRTTREKSAMATRSFICGRDISESESSCAADAWSPRSCRTSR